MCNQVIHRQRMLVEELSFFINWEDKYDYIISLGKKLPKFPDNRKIKINLVRGCQSQVWFDSSFKNGKLYFISTSDALIVSGLIGLILRIYNDATPEDIMESNADFIKEIGFVNNLSATRANGLNSMLQYIYAQALKLQ